MTNSEPKKKPRIAIAKASRQVWYVKRTPFFALSLLKRYSITGTGANAQVFRIAICIPFIPMPPTIMAFMATRNICSPK